MAQIDTLTNVGAVVSTDLALILRGGANVLGTFGSLVGQNATSVTITGGTVNNTVIGGVTPAAGSFTTVGATGAATFSGNLLVGTTDTFPGGGDTNTGVSLTSTGAVVASRDGDFAARFNRKNSDGEIIGLNKDGAPVGSIGSHAGIYTYIGTDDTALLFAGNIDAFMPFSPSASNYRDNAIDLGTTTGRFKDLWLSGTVNAGAATFSDTVWLLDGKNIYLGTDGDMRVRHDNSNGYIDCVTGSLILRTGGGATERMTLDANGNLGLGAVPSAWGSVWKVSQIGLGAGFGGRTNGTQADVYENLYRDATNYKYKTSAAASIYTQVVGNFIWSNAGVGTAGATAAVTQRMTLNANGVLCLNVAGPTNPASKMAIGLSAGNIAIETRPNNGDGYYANFFYSQGAAIAGYIYVSATTTNFSQSSDYRLKEDAVPMTGATERVKALRPINFAWKLDGSRVDGFLAHEAQEVVPEAVHGTKDAMRDEEYEVTPAVEEVRDEEGNVTTEAVAAVMGTRSVPDMQGIDQSKLVPLLTAALQEAITKIEDLTARIEALEGS